MKNIFTLIIALFIASVLHSQDLKSYQIYDKKAKPVSFGQMIEQLKDYDVVLFGEFHNNAVIHWLELRTTEALYQKKNEQLILGAEMFERDNQKYINYYLSDIYDSEQLNDSARLWQNFKTDYKPLLDFAKEKNLKFVATNIPRRYAQLVAKNDIDTLEKLPQSDQKYMVKLPIKVSLKTPGYGEMKQFMPNHADNKIMNFIKAQATKDATMAESILKNRYKNDLFLHFNGNYHSKDYGGIYWYLKKQKPWLKHLKIAVITVYESQDSQLAYPDADKTITATEFMLVVPEDMTKTY